VKLIIARPQRSGKWNGKRQGKGERDEGKDMSVREKGTGLDISSPYP
jgi:hypothetical protein